VAAGSNKTLRTARGGLRRNARAHHVVGIARPEHDPRYTRHAAPETSLAAPPANGPHIARTRVRVRPRISLPFPQEPVIVGVVEGVPNPAVRSLRVICR